MGNLKQWKESLDDILRQIMSDSQVWNISNQAPQSNACPEGLINKY